MKLPLFVAPIHFIMVNFSFHVQFFPFSNLLFAAVKGQVAKWLWFPLQKLGKTLALVAIGLLGQSDVETSSKRSCLTLVPV
jgi:hypothetical protein